MLHLFLQEQIVYVQTLYTLRILQQSGIKSDPSKSRHLIIFFAAKNRGKYYRRKLMVTWWERGAADNLL